LFLRIVDGSDPWEADDGQRSLRSLDAPSAQWALLRLAAELPVSLAPAIANAEPA
jgi:hypothetical protein